jgi:hypothetical protein
MIRTRTNAMRPKNSIVGNLSAALEEVPMPCSSTACNVGLDDPCTLVFRRDQIVDSSAMYACGVKVRPSWEVTASPLRSRTAYWQTSLI